METFKARNSVDACAGCVHASRNSDFEGYWYDCLCGHLSPVFVSRNERTQTNFYYCKDHKAKECYAR